MKRTLIFLIFSVSVLLAILTRFYKLGDAPAGLYLDEAAQGYNAYSILKTGKDEFGKEFPIIFRSFTDFKTPVYIYLIVPLIPIFGLSKFTVRFPSFLFSIMTLPVLYLLIKKVSPGKIAHKLALTVVVLLAISPWHILFGRTNFECNVALFFLLTGIYYFYRGLEKPVELIISALFFAIAIPSYHAQRVVTPLVILALFFRHRKTLISGRYRTYLIGGCILGFLMLLPTLSVSLTPGFLMRAGLNIFTHAKQLPVGYMEEVPDILSVLVNNSVFLSLREFLSLYFSYLSPRNMFILGDYGQRSSFPGLSTFFIWQFPFYLAGLWKLMKSKNLGELKFLTITLLLISPLPAAVTRDPYSTIRSLQLVIPQLTIISLGILSVYSSLKKLILKKSVPFFIYNSAVTFATVILITYSLAKLYSSVLVTNEFYRASEWNYGYEKMAESIRKLDPALPVIVDSARTEPYSQLLFFLKFDPETYQKENFEVPTTEYYVNMNRNKTKYIGNITTKPIVWDSDLNKEQYLIGDSLSISEDQIKEHGLTLIEIIKYPDGSPAFILTKTNPDFPNI